MKKSRNMPPKLWENQVFYFFTAVVILLVSEIIYYTSRIGLFKKT